MRTRDPDPIAHCGIVSCCLKAFYLSERLHWYLALPERVVKPALGPPNFLAHASFLGKLEAPVIGGLFCAHAPQVRNAYLVLRLVLRSCRNICKNRHYNAGQDCHLEDLLHL